MNWYAVAALSYWGGLSVLVLATSVYHRKR